MKILQFTPRFFPVMGGTTTRLYNLLINDGNIHFLYHPYPRKIQVPHKNDNKFRNIKVRRSFLFKKSVRIRFFNKIFSNIILFLINRKRLFNSVQEDNLDIVHGHNPILFGFTAMKYALKNQIPFIYEIHVFNSDNLFQYSGFFLSKLIDYFFDMIKRYRIKKVLKNANKIIIQSNAIKKRLLNTFEITEEKLVIIPMGVDLDDFNPNKWSKEGKNLRNLNNWSEKIVFMYNGYLNKYNGVKLLLEAMIELPEDIKRNIKLIILGRGPFKNFIKNTSTKLDFIDFLGLKHYDDMPAYYSASDVVVTPRLNTYVKDNVPTKLLEAMAMEKIILGSDINSIKNLIKNGVNGFLFKSGNKDDLIEKLIFIIENFGEFENVRKRARIDVQNRYSWKRMRKKLKSIYSSIKKERNLIND